MHSYINIFFFRVTARFRSNGRDTATGFSCRVFAHQRTNLPQPPTTTATTTTTTTTSTPEVKFQIYTYMHIFLSALEANHS